jgi:hypothetical protein
MIAMTVESAKNIGIAVAGGALVVMVVMAWLIKNVVTKVMSVVILGGLAFGVWTQRSSLETCANKVKDRALVGGVNEISCSFLGSDIKVPVPSVPQG